LLDSNSNITSRHVTRSIVGVRNDGYSETLRRASFGSQKGRCRHGYKSVMGKAADAAKSLAGAALGAAARAATSVVAETVAGAMTEGGAKLANAGPRLEKAAGARLSKPMLPNRRKRPAAKRKSKVATKKLVAVRAAKSKRGARPRKKR
jgi:hypothetical protein